MAVLGLAFARQPTRDAVTSPGFWACRNPTNTRFSLNAAGKPVRWRAVAKDGADLPPSQAIESDAMQGFRAGEICDFVYTPAWVRI